MAGIQEMNDVAPTHRRQATFTELYELILYNDTLVRTECELLKKILEVKISKKRPPGPLRVVDSSSADPKNQAFRASCRRFE